MKLTRRKRIAVELLGPPLIGAVFVTLWAVASLARHSPNRDEALRSALAAAPMLLGLYVLFAIPMSGIQAGLYTLIMEWRFSRGLNPNTWRTVVLSTLLGFVSGGVIALGYGYERKDTWYVFNGIGLGVGFVLGLLIKICPAEKKTNGGSNP